LPDISCDLPGSLGGPPSYAPLFGLAPGGVCRIPRSPGELVRSYRTFSPLPGPKPAGLRPGGILSVALSFASPRLHVMKHPALRCSDFPLAPFAEPAIVWVTPTVGHYPASKLSSHNWGNFSSCRISGAHCTSGRECSCYIPGKRHRELPQSPRHWPVWP